MRQAKPNPWRLRRPGSWPTPHKPPARRRWQFARHQAKSVSTGGNGGRDARLTRVEAVLFVAREPLSSRKLAHFAGLLDGTEARTLVRRLNRLYSAESRAFAVEEVAGGFQLMTRAKFAPWLRRLYQSPVETRLSVPAMETLAVVAYRQPVLRAEIDAVRGVDCGEILRQLMERDLVRIAGRSDDLGRPYLYGTTKRFLQIFGLRHLDDLPRAGILRARQMAVVSADDRPITDRTAELAAFASEVSEPDDPRHARSSR
jgi:segregation and condensation protein B